MQQPSGTSSTGNNEARNGDNNKRKSPGSGSEMESIPSLKDRRQSADSGNGNHLHSHSNDNDSNDLDDGEWDAVIHGMGNNNETNVGTVSY